MHCVLCCACHTLCRVLWCFEMSSRDTHERHACCVLCCVLCVVCCEAAGLWGGAIGILVLGLLCDYIDYRVIQCKRKLFGGRTIAYPDLAEATFGLWVVRHLFHRTTRLHDQRHATYTPTPCCWRLRREECHMYFY
jgi:hypothetical protein